MENTDDPPMPVLNNLFLVEVAGPVKINLTTIDSADPQDYYTKLVVRTVAISYCIGTYGYVHLSILHCSVSLVLIPAYSEIESVSFNGADTPGITVTSYRHSIVS